MKLLNPEIRCGGRLGCGMVFEFGKGATVKEAAEVFAKHRAEPGHMDQVLAETNTNRLLDGLAPLRMDEFLRTVG